jgi:hypothetical protein
MQYFILGPIRVPCISGVASTGLPFQRRRNWTATTNKTETPSIHDRHQISISIVDPSITHACVTEDAANDVIRLR